MALPVALKVKSPVLLAAKTQLVTLIGPLEEMPHTQLKKVSLLKDASGPVLAVE